MSSRGAPSSCPFAVCTRQAPLARGQGYDTTAADNAARGRHPRASTDATFPPSVARVARQVDTTERPGSCRRAGMSGRAWSGGRAEYSKEYLAVGHQALVHSESVPPLERTGDRATNNISAKASAPSDSATISVAKYSVGKRRPVTPDHGALDVPALSGETRFTTTASAATLETAQLYADMPKFGAMSPRGVYHPRVRRPPQAPPPYLPAGYLRGRGHVL